MNRSHGFKPDGARGGFTLVEMLVVIAIIGIIASVLLPSLQTSREETNKVQYSSNLKNIYTYALLFSNRSRSHAYPIASGKSPPAHESLQILVEKFPAEFKPVFVCPSGDAVEAEADENGKFVLDESSSNYTWVSRKTKNTAHNRALSSDKHIDKHIDEYEYEDEDGEHQGHPGGIMVVDTGGSIRFWEEDALDEELMLPKVLVH